MTEIDPGVVLHQLVSARVATGMSREEAQRLTFTQHPRLAQLWNAGETFEVPALAHPANRPLTLPYQRPRSHHPPLSELRRLAEGEEPPAGATLLHKCTDVFSGGGVFVMAEAA